MSGRKNVRIMTRVITQNGIKVSASPDLPSGHFCRVLLPQLAALYICSCALSFDNV